MRKRTVWAVTVLGVCVSAITPAQETQEEWPAAGKSRAAWFGGVIDKMLPVTVYGKVVDLTGAPLAGVSVGIQWEDMSVLTGGRSGNHLDHVQSDVSGCWTLTLSKPHRAFISEVIKEGHEYVYGGKDYHRDLADGKNKKDSPVISVMRRRCP